VRQSEFIFCSVTGHLESVYEEALGIELPQQKITFARQSAIAVNYKRMKVSEGRLDLLVENRLIVELKAVEALALLHRAQVLSYSQGYKITIRASYQYSMRQF
jgi:GxxExxY protein